MKLNYTIEPHYNFVLEGTPQEILDFVNMTVRDAGRSVPRVTSMQVIEPKQTKTKRSAKRAPSAQTDETTNNFLRSVYVYEPNTASKSGRGAWVAQQILKGNTFNVHRLAAQAHASTSTVHKAVAALRNAGAVIDTTPTTVKLVSIPEPPYTAKFKSNRKPRPNEAKTNATSSTSINRAANLMDALKSMKVD